MEHLSIGEAAKRLGVSVDVVRSLEERGELKAVRRLRKSAGYSQESFADACGLHRTYMGAVERGETNISLDNIERIARALRLTPAQLLGEAERER